MWLFLFEELFGNGFRFGWCLIYKYETMYVGMFSIFLCVFLKVLWIFFKYFGIVVCFST